MFNGDIGYGCLASLVQHYSNEFYRCRLVEGMDVDVDEVVYDEQKDKVEGRRRGRRHSCGAAHALNM